MCILHAWHSLSQQASWSIRGAQQSDLQWPHASSSNPWLLCWQAERWCRHSTMQHALTGSSEAHQNQECLTGRPCSTAGLPEGRCHFMPLAICIGDNNLPLHMQRESVHALRVCPAVLPHKLTHSA